MMNDMANCFNSSSVNCTVCDQFCTVVNDNCTPGGANYTNHYENVIDYIYIATGILSLFGGVLVFVTYALIPRLNKKRSTKRAILLRTMLDTIAAVVSILSAAIPEVKSPSKCECSDWSSIGCKIFGIMNTFLFLASLTWYLVLSLEMYFAIKSPFSVDNKYRVLSHIIGWVYPTLFTLVMVVLAATYTDTGAGVDPIYGAGPGLSMFHICWISVKSPLWVYIVLHLVGYILPLILSGIVAVIILFLVFRLLRTKLPASSEIRREVLKQNFLFVSFITVEFIIYIVLWIAQMIAVSTSNNDPCDIRCPRFGGTCSLVLAGIFAFTHGSKGVVDFTLWCLSNSIKWKDIRGYFCCLCGKNKRYHFRSGVRSTPLINKETIEVDKTLRRDVMYAINLGILKVIDEQIAKKEEDHNRFSRSGDSLGDVVDDFIEAKEWESGQKVILAVGGSKDVKMSFKPSDLGLAIKFVNVEPEVFAHLRVSYGTNLEGYRESFFINDIRDIESSGMLERFTEGKSGSFFYFTRDSRYIIKTVTDQEVETMKKLAVPYYRHMRDNPDTLLPRFFGLYRVRMASEQKYISVIVMDNIFFSDSKMKMTVKYDLKGSTHGRRTLKRKKTARDHYKGTLKDLDLDRKIILGGDNTERLLRQLEEDTKFLSNFAIMDYSLLLGIHIHNGKEQSQTGFIARALPGETGFTVVDSPASASNTESEIGFGLTSSTTFHTPWFRQDGGGLRSTASNHPASGHEMVTGVSDSVEMLEMSSLNTKSVPETYFIGIIDILQEYNWTKRAEHFLKTKFLCANPHAISAVNQREYAERFVDFMKNSVFVHE